VVTRPVVLRKDEQAPQDSPPNPCAGWERDTESFAIALAKVYYKAGFPNPTSPNPLAVSVKPGWIEKSWWVTFDNGDVVGIVRFKSNPHGAFACPKVTDKHPAMPGSKSRECDVMTGHSYTWSCTADGQITFTR
jgi:hypothetical protein